MEWKVWVSTPNANQKKKEFLHSQYEEQVIFILLSELCADCTGQIRLEKFMHAQTLMWYEWILFHGALVSILGKVGVVPLEQFTPETC